LQADERASEQYEVIAHQAIDDGDLMEAFRARCRAMLVLMEAIHQHRGKLEEFKPLWEPPRRDELELRP